MSDEKQNYQGLCTTEKAIKAARQAAREAGIDIEINESHGEYGFFATEEQYKRFRKRYTQLRR